MMHESRIWVIYVISLLISLIISALEVSLTTSMVYFRFLMDDTATFSKISNFLETDFSMCSALTA